MFIIDDFLQLVWTTYLFIVRIVRLFTTIYYYDMPSKMTIILGFFFRMNHLVESALVEDFPQKSL